LTARTGEFRPGSRLRREGHHELFAGRPTSGAPSGVVVTIHVDDVDEAYERAQTLGAEIATELRDEAHGQRHFIVVDPNGLLLNVMSAL
jgi:uncharacterized glyoxalase superfamily protein PhnB